MKFIVTGTSSTGEAVRLSVDAADRDAAEWAVRNRGIQLISIEPDWSGGKPAREAPFRMVLLGFYAFMAIVSFTTCVVRWKFAASFAKESAARVIGWSAAFGILFLVLFLFQVPKVLAGLLLDYDAHRKVRRKGPPIQ